VRIRFALRVLGAAALGTSAYVHIHLADQFDYPGTISGGTLFRTQGAVAALIALFLLVTGHRLAWLAGAGLGLTSFAAVMLYRYVDVGAIGPLPNMNDPTWRPSPDKLLSAIVEAGVVVLFIVDELMRRRGAGQLLPHRGGTVRDDNVHAKA
jgi:hypothetical protein